MSRKRGEGRRQREEFGGIQPRHSNRLAPSGQQKSRRVSVGGKWSGRRGSNPRRSPWQYDTILISNIFITNELKTTVWHSL
jgi:hypothetical protein